MPKHPVNDIEPDLIAALACIDKYHRHSYSQETLSSGGHHAYCGPSDVIK
jgi:hypothetical protein